MDHVERPKQLGGVDAEGNPRTIPVRLRGLVVWHSRAELDRFWRGVDREASRLLAQEARS